MNKDHHTLASHRITPHTYHITLFRPSHFLVFDILDDILIKCIREKNANGSDVTCRHDGRRGGQIDGHFGTSFARILRRVKRFEGSLRHSLATNIAREPYSEWRNRARCGFPTVSDDVHAVSTPSGVSPNGIIF